MSAPSTTPTFRQASDMEVTLLEATVKTTELIENGIINIPKMGEGCKSCEHFGTRWACPPYDFDLEKLWKSHAVLRVVGIKITLDEESRSRKIATEEYGNFCGEILAPYKRQLHADLLRLESENPGSRAISPGSCDSCALPCPKTQGKPCRKADMRETLEALGADVSRLAEEYLSTPLLWLKDGQPPEYFVLAGGLLV